MLAEPAFVPEFILILTSHSLDDACGGWEALHYLLRQLVGWRDPGAGLAWWYRSGKPMHDSRALQLVAEVWGRGDRLDEYAAWCWTHGNFAPASESSETLARNSAFSDEGWWRAFRGRRRSTTPSPFGGGYNPLHLGRSDDFGLDESPLEASQLYVQPSARAAVLIVSGLRSWRAELKRASQMLPALGERSWRVEVFDRQVGFLGLYRESRVTGRWFLGKHSVHLHGNP